MSAKHISKVAPNRLARQKAWMNLHGSNACMFDVACLFLNSPRSLVLLSSHLHSAMH